MSSTNPLYIAQYFPDIKFSTILPYLPPQKKSDHQITIYKLI